MKNILCYGDSNTWGYIPGTMDLEILYMERYSRDKRWTGILQKRLGDQYHVIEEGLNGRTTNIDYAEIPGKNGKIFLPICLYSQSPLDLVILMLGGNDLKMEFNRSSLDIAAGLSELVEIIQASTFGPDMRSAPPVLLIGYPTFTHENGFDGMFVGSLKRGKDLGAHMAAVARKYECAYFDAAPHLQLSEIDGIHFDEECHAQFGRLLYGEVEALLG